MSSTSNSCDWAHDLLEIPEKLYQEDKQEGAPFVALHCEAGNRLTELITLRIKIYTKGKHCIALTSSFERLTSSDKYK